MKIGVMAELLRKSFMEDIDYAAEIGVEGIQIGVTHGAGEINLSDCTARELDALRARCDRNGLTISAVCGDLGGSFQVRAEAPGRIALMKKIIDSAAALGVRVITTHIGHIPEWRQDPTYQEMLQSIRPVAEYAEKRHCVLAVETGPELADVLKAFLEDIGNGGVGVNLDPANLRGVCCEDPVYAVETLGRYIVHTHAKDSVNLYVGSAAKFYGLKNPDGSLRDIVARASGFKEVPLGQGMVPWDAYLAALRQIGYQGFLTIERECGEDPVGDIKMAVGFLRSKLG